MIGNDHNVPEHIEINRIEIEQSNCSWLMVADINALIALIIVFIPWIISSSQDQVSVEYHSLKGNKILLILEHKQHESTLLHLQSAIYQQNFESLAVERRRWYLSNDSIQSNIDTC